MPAQKRPYVSPETAARLADLQRRMSAAEGRTLTTDEVVSRMIEDYEVLGHMGGKIAAAIESLVDDAGGCMASIPALEAEVAQKDARIAELIGERDSLMDQCHGLQRLADERDGLRMRAAALEKALAVALDVRRSGTPGETYELEVIGMGCGEGRKTPVFRPGM